MQSPWYRRRAKWAEICVSCSKDFVEHEDAGDVQTLLSLRISIDSNRTSVPLRTSRYTTMRDLKQLIAELVGVEASRMRWTVEESCVGEITLDDVPAWARVCDVFTWLCEDSDIIIDVIAGRR